MRERRTFTGDFQRFFGRGLAILLPSVLTLWLLVQAFVFVYRAVAEPINAGIRMAVIEAVPQVVDEGQLPRWFTVSPEVITARLEERERQGLELSRLSDGTFPEARRQQIRREIRGDRLEEIWDRYWYLGGLGLLIAILLIYFAGVFVTNYFGRKLYGFFERLISKIPGFKQVYPHVKQVVDLVLGERAMAFNKVVLVEYPRRGIWTIGLVSGPATPEMHRRAKGEVVTVFIPTSPTPFTGFTINCRKDELYEMEMTVDQALRFVITAGVLTPDALESAADLPPDASPAEVMERVRLEQERALRDRGEGEGGRPV
jgi:uncharacterized membrane protein